MYKLAKGPCNVTAINPIKVIKDPLEKKCTEPGIVPDNFRQPASYRLGDKKLNTSASAILSLFLNAYMAELSTLTSTCKVVFFLNIKHLSAFTQINYLAM